MRVALPLVTFCGDARISHMQMGIVFCTLVKLPQQLFPGCAIAFDTNGPHACNEFICVLQSTWESGGGGGGGDPAAAAVAQFMHITRATNPAPIVAS
jgi:hypothetical protein